MKIGLTEMKIFAKLLLVCVGFSILGWTTRWFNISVSYVLLICVLYSWHGTFQHTRKAKDQLSKSFFHDEKKTVQDVFDHLSADLPRWVFFPDIERAEWLNKYLHQLWPGVTDYLFQYINKDLEDQIRSCLPQKLKSFCFKKVDLGDLPPKVSGIKVYEEHTSRDEIVMDLDIFYAGDANILIKVSKLEAGLQDLRIKGTLRLVFKPLLKQPPFIGGLQVYMLSEPTLQFNFTHTASVLEIPGLYDLLKKALLTQISNYLILPNMLTFSFSESVNCKELRLIEPMGILNVQVVEAKNLTDSDITSKSDPYALVKVGGEVYSTEVVRNSQNPVWNQLFTFTVLETDGVSLEVNLFDDDDSFKDDALGRQDCISLPLQAIIEDGFADTWKDVGVGCGSVHLICQWMNLSSNVDAMKGCRTNSRPSYVLSVFVDCAKNLMNPLSSTSDPSTLVEVSVGCAVKQTKPVLLTPNPCYEENFHFLLDEIHLETLRVMVLDAKGKKSVGSTSIVLAKCLESEDMTIETRPYLLRGNQTNSEIILRLSIKKTLPAEMSLRDENHNKEPSRLSVADAPAGVGKSSPLLPPHNSQLPTTPNLRRSSLDSKSSTLSSSPKNPRDVVSRTLGANHTVIMGTASLDRRRSSYDDAMSPLKPRRRSGDLPSPSHDYTTKSQGQGQMQLSLHYDLLRERIKVTLHQCRDLKVMADYYVKIYLLPDRDHKKSQTIKDASHPVFNESFEFDVSHEAISQKTLEITLKIYESMFSKKEVGHCEIDLAEFDLTALTTRWFDLKPSSKDM